MDPIKHKYTAKEFIQDRTNKSLETVIIRVPHESCWALSSLAVAQVGSYGCVFEGLELRGSGSMRFMERCLRLGASEVSMKLQPQS